MAASEKNKKLSLIKILLLLFKKSEHKGKRRMLYLSNDDIIEAAKTVTPK